MSVLLYVGAGTALPEIEKEEKGCYTFDKYILADTFPMKGGCSCCMPEWIFKVGYKKRFNWFLEKLEDNFGEGKDNKKDKIFEFTYEGKPLIYYYDKDVEKQFEEHKQATDIYFCNYAPSAKKVKELIEGKTVWIRYWINESGYGSKVKKFPIEERDKMQTKAIIKLLEEQYKFF